MVSQHTELYYFLLLCCLVIMLLCYLVTLLLCFKVASFNLLVDFVEALIGERILIDEVADNKQKDGRNDRREQQNGILCNLRIISQLRIVGIHWCADERCQEHHHEDAQHQLETLVGLELLPHLTE